MEYFVLGRKGKEKNLETYKQKRSLLKSGLFKQTFKLLD